MSAALVIGALTTVAAAVRADAMPYEADDGTPVPDCRVAVVLVATDPASWVSRLVDRVTGNRGYSHVYIDPCRAKGRDDIIDFTPMRGVHWSTSKKYEGRPRVRFELDGDDASALWGCVRARIGHAWRLPIMLGPRESAATCVGLAASCMPSTMRSQLESLREGPCLSPNTLARYFGVA